MGSQNSTAAPCVGTLERVILKYGAPETMHTDQGSQFNCVSRGSRAKCRSAFSRNRTTDA